VVVALEFRPRLGLLVEPLVEFWLEGLHEPGCF
jgi:hypothetical protein